MICACSNKLKHHQLFGTDSSQGETRSFSIPEVNIWCCAKLLFFLKSKAELLDLHLQHLADGFILSNLHTSYFRALLKDSGGSSLAVVGFQQ